MHGMFEEMRQDFACDLQIARGPKPTSYALLTENVQLWVEILGGGLVRCLQDFCDHHNITNQGVGPLGRRIEGPPTSAEAGRPGSAGAQALIPLGSTDSSSAGELFASVRMARDRYHRHRQWFTYNTLSKCDRWDTLADLAAAYQRLLALATSSDARESQAVREEFRKYGLGTSKGLGWSTVVINYLTCCSEPVKDVKRLNIAGTEEFKMRERYRETVYWGLPWQMLRDHFTRGIFILFPDRGDG